LGYLESTDESPVPFAHIAASWTENAGTIVCSLPGAVGKRLGLKAEWEQVMLILVPAPQCPKEHAACANGGYNTAQNTMLLRGFHLYQPLHFTLARRIKVL
jgi:hypothetical protein